jgi:phage FluMu protein Com
MNAKSLCLLMIILSNVYVEADCPKCSDYNPFDGCPTYKQCTGDNKKDK